MSTLSRHCFSLAAFWALASIASAQAAPASLMAPFDLGAPSKWDFAAVDAPRHRLFLSRGERVQVVDTRSGSVLGEIPGTKGVHGIEFAEDLHVGFTSNGASDSVTVFDVDSLKRIKDIPVGGKSPDAMVYDAPSHRLFVFNGHSGNITVIDAKTLAVQSNLAADGHPEFAVRDDRGQIFLNLEEDKGAMNVIDAATAKVVKQWTLPGCASPTGLAIDMAHRRLFSACANHVMAITDADDGHAVGSVPIGDHPDAAIYDGQGRVYVSNGDGSLTVVQQQDADHYRVQATVQTAKGAKTMARDADLRRIYLPTVVDGHFVVIVVQEGTP